MSTAMGWTERLLPENDELFLDHVGFFVKDLEGAANRLSLLGFQISPVNVHYSNNGSGEVVPTGTSNRLVVLKHGYVEILSGSGETPLAQELCEALARYEGLHLIALSHRNMAEQRLRLTAQGFSMQQVLELRRSVKTPSGERQFACSVLRTQPGEMAEGRIQMLTHCTPELLWMPEVTVHDNGAYGLTDILICVEDPARDAQRYSRFTGRSAIEIENGFLTVLDRGRILFVRPQGVQEIFPHFSVPNLPFIAGIAMVTANVEKTCETLSHNGVQHVVETDNIACIDSADALGAYLVFHSNPADPPWSHLAKSKALRSGFDALTA